MNPTITELLHSPTPQRAFVTPSLRSIALPQFLVAACLIPSASVASATPFSKYYVSTRAVTYTGTVTQYGSLADAINQTNPLGAAVIIPNRPTTYGSPTQTTATEFVAPYRDLRILMSHELPAYRPDSTYFYANWSGGHAGTTPENSNPGFVQYFNDVPRNAVAYGPISFDTHNEAYFSGLIGSTYTEMTLHVAGANAQNSTTRSWEGASGNAGAGIFHTWDLNVTFFGLVGTENATTHVIEAGNHPTSAAGTLTGVFEATANPGVFNRFDYTISTDNNWYLGESANAPQIASAFVALAIPEPSTSVLAAVGGMIVAFARRRSV